MNEIRRYLTKYDANAPVARERRLQNWANNIKAYVFQNRLRKIVKWQLRIPTLAFAY